MVESFTMQDEMRRAFAVLSGKWKLEILWLLNQRVHRFGELRKSIVGVTQHTLTSQLRELEEDGLITRTPYAEIPLRVDYAITDKARDLGPVLEALSKWWAVHGQDTPIRPRRGRNSTTGTPGPE